MKTNYWKICENHNIKVSLLKITKTKLVGNVEIYNFCVSYFLSKTQFQGVINTLDSQHKLEADMVSQFVKADQVIFLTWKHPGVHASIFLSRAMIRF